MRSRLVPLLLGHARRKGADDARLADRFGIPLPCRDETTWDLDAPPVPISAVIELAGAVARELDDEWLGLSLAGDLPRGVFGVQEFAVRNAPTIGEAALRLVRYQRLTNDAIVWDAKQTDSAAILSLSVPGAPAGLGRHLNECLIAVALRYTRELVERPIVPHRVELAQMGPPPDPGSFAEQLGIPEPVLGTGANLLAFDRAVWDQAIPSADAALLPIVERYAQHLMPVEDSARGWEARVRDHLRRQLSGGAPTLEAAAAAIGMTARSLQRRLQEAGTSYRVLLDGLREAEARRLLAQTDVPVDEISFLLGYSERRAFNRAFSRWTGRSPSAYREAARGGPRSRGGDRGP